MKEDFYAQLLEVSCEHDSRLLFDGRVCFDINEVCLVFDFKTTEPLNEDAITALHEIKNLPIKLSKLSVEGIFVYLAGFTRDEDSMFDPEIPKGNAVTGIMYHLVQNILRLNPQIVKSFDTFIDFEGLIEGVSGYCDTELSWLAAKIEFNTEMGSMLDIVNFIATYSTNLPTLGEEYSFFFEKRNQDQLRDNFNLNILHTSTKTRRLGYLRLLSTMFDAGKQHPINRFNKFFEDAGAALEEQLLNYQNSKGLIKKTKSGISAKPYIELAHDLDLINYLRSSVVQGKMFKVYAELKKAELTKSNYFELTKLDKLFFLEQILRQDALYIFITLESLFLLGESSLHSLQPIFHERLLKRLKKFENFVIYKGDERKLKELQGIRQRVEDWQKPEKYLEHVLMPRLNWMLDLGLVSFTQKNTFNITDIGERLLKHYWNWQDLYGEVVINPNSILDFVYLTIFDDIYEVGTGNQQTEEFIKKRIAAVLLDSFDHFKTIAPNRVTASQAIAFTQYYLFLNESVKIEKHYIRNLLSSEFTEKFIYKYQPQYQDGYIQIIKQHEF